MAYRPIPLPGAGAPALSQIKIDTFLGADLTSSPENVEAHRSPDCENMIRSAPGKVRKRMGWRTVHRLPGAVHGYHTLAGHAALLHAGTVLYQRQADGWKALYEGAADARSTSWQLGGTACIADGKALLLYDGTAVTRADAAAYVPTLTIARAPSGGGESFESLNLLQPAFTEQFLGTAGDTSYQLSFAPLDAAPVRAQVLQPDGSWQTKAEHTDFTVNRAAGTVTFAAAPGASPVSGQDNVKITASRTVAGYAERINRCTAGILYGVNGASDRLFLTGNAQYPNYDWYSGRGDPTYWSDTAYSVLGQPDSAVVGYSIVSAHLAAHKNGALADRNVILREGVLTDGKPSFPVTGMLQGEGAVAPHTFCYLAAEPVFLTRLGVYAITAQDITGEKYSQCRSFYLNGALLREPHPEDAFAFVYRDLYWLCLNGKAYILDGLQAAGPAGAAPYSARQCAGFYCTGIPARVLWQQDGALWFGTQDGRVCAFAGDENDLSSYADDGLPVYACWRTPDLRGHSVYRNKTFSRFYAELASATYTGLRALARVGGAWQELFGDFASARYFCWSRLTWSKWTWSGDATPRTLGGKIRIKKVDKAGFKVENGQLCEPFGLNSISLEFVETGYYKT